MYHLNNKPSISFRSGFTKFFWAFGLILTSVAIGTCGYIYFEGYTLVDALYMSFLALSTVGFGEVAPLSNAGKIFTIFYIVFNIATLAYAISVITLYLFEGEFRKMFRTYLIGRKVRKLKDHVIVCGYGRNGAKACEELLKSKQPFVVVENNEEILEFLPDKPKFDVINGSALDEETLLLAGIDHARAIICTWQNDSDNMVITLTAKQMNPDIQIVTKASNDRSEKKLFAAGAQSVVRPYSLGGIHLANLVTRPYVIEFLELISGVGDHQLKLEEFTFKELKKEFRNKTIQELDIRRNTGATIIGLKAPEKGFIFNPNRDMTITEGDVMIIFGTDESIDKFKIYCD